MNEEASKYAFLIQTNEGVMTPTQFLEELFERVWPYGADTIDFTLTDDVNCEPAVTYVIQPFGTIKTNDCRFKLSPGKLTLNIGEGFSTSTSGDLDELSTIVSNILFEDFAREAIL